MNFTSFMYPSLIKHSLLSSAAAVPLPLWIPHLQTRFAFTQRLLKSWLFYHLRIQNKLFQPSPKYHALPKLQKLSKILLGSSIQLRCGADTLPVILDMAQKARTKSIQLKGMEFADQLAQSMLDHATTMEKTYQDLKKALAAEPPSDKKIKSIIQDVDTKQKWFEKAEVGEGENLLGLVVLIQWREKPISSHI